MSSAEAPVQVERDGRVMTVRLVNPPHNFMTRPMVVGLADVVAGLAEDSTIRAVIITGGIEGKFITHYDVAEILAGAEGLSAEVGPRAAGATLAAAAGLERVPGLGDALRRTPASGVLALREIHDLFLAMNRLDKVLIAAIGGTAMGGGCELALACDMRVMAIGAGEIGLPEALIGIQPGAGGTQRLAHAVGPARALEMILEGEGLDAEQAVAAGLATRAVPADRLMDEARTIAERMARRSPHSVLGAKRSIYFGATARLPAGLAEERRWFLSGGSTSQARDGLAAYAAQVEELGRAPVDDPDAAAAWRDGRVRDLGGES
ncbi:MAG TPA: enoyl-CoA hydratase/isomerase family protein [Solirubrobacterales bacterium]|nr:enoyl-CoA hydratase/isomerase family protein [Solirubrobacterales bacterium]